MTANWHLGEALIGMGIAGPTTSHQQVKAFHGSDYGINFDSGSSPTVIPYLVKPSNLGITLFSQNAVSAPGSISGAVVLDDSTMVIAIQTASNATGMSVLTRSGNAIAFSGTQQVVTTDTGVGNRVSLTRIDSTTFIRAYEAVVAGASVTTLDFCSVGGGTIGISGSYSFPSSSMTIDGLGIATSRIAEGVLHTDGSGLIVSLAVGTLSGNFDKLLVLEFGGSTVTALHAMALPFLSTFSLGTGTEGSTEIAMRTVSTAAGLIGFYWDGAAGHFGSIDVVFASVLAGGPSGGDGNEANPYFAPGALDGSLTSLGSVEITQSGATLSPATVTVTYGAQRPSAVSSMTRHGSANLVVGTYANTFGTFDLIAGSW